MQGHARGFRVTLRALIVALTCAVLPALAAPASAAGASATSISFYSDPGDFIGQGRQRVFHPGNSSQLGAKLKDGELVAFAVGGQPLEGYSFSFAAPRGESLEPRNYVGVQRLDFRRPGYAGMDVEGESRGCNELEGRFEVRQLEVDAQGNVDRLWIVFQQHCEHRYAAGYGEIRINAWVPEEQAMIAPGVVRWAPLDTWRSVSSVPVTYRGSAPVASVGVAGTHAGDVSVDPGGCVGRPGPCDVLVSFDPRGPGSRTASLRIGDAAGTVHAVALEGFEFGGTTRAEFEVLPGDVASQPGRYVYTPANARFSGDIFDAGATLAVEENGRGPFWSGDFKSGGPAIGPGTFTAPSSGGAAGPILDVYGSPIGCARVGGEFTIREVRRLPDGTLRSFDVSFLQRCYADRREALRGTWRFRAGDTSSLAPWMEPGPRQRIDAPPTQGPAGTAAPGGAAASGGAQSPSGLPQPGSTPSSTPADAGTAASPSTAARRALPAGCPAAIGRSARTLSGTRGRDRLIGTAGSDVLLGGGGADVLRGLGGRDCLVGGAGRDRLDGGAQDDVLFGGAGDDLLVGGSGRDLLDCGPGPRDRAVTTAGDRTRGCESVRRARRG